MSININTCSNDYNFVIPKTKVSHSNVFSLGAIEKTSVFDTFIATQSKKF